MKTKKLKIGFASDHAGYQLKQKLITYIKDEVRLAITDYGTDSEKSVDYPDFAKKLMVGIEFNIIDFGVLICSSGIGMSICANRNQFVRATLCHNAELAKLAREHNNANVIALGASFISFEDSKKIVEAFLTAEFQGGRHLRRVQKI